MWYNCNGKIIDVCTGDPSALPKPNKIPHLHIFWHSLLFDIEVCSSSSPQWWKCTDDESLPVHRGPGPLAPISAPGCHLIRVCMSRWSMLLHACYSSTHADEAHACFIVLYTARSMLISHKQRMHMVEFQFYNAYWQFLSCPLPLPSITITSERYCRVIEQ